MRTHILYITLIIGLAILCLFLFKGGCKTAVTSSQEYKDLYAAKDAANRLILAKDDSLLLIERKYNEDGLRSSAIIQSLMLQKESLSDATGKLKASVSDITKAYRAARDSSDAITALLLADQQSNTCEEYVWQSQREMFVADSIITQQNLRISAQNSSIQKQIQFKNEFLLASAQKDNANNQMIYLLRRDNKKLNNWWNRWGSKVAVGAVGSLAGYAVGSMAK